MPTTMDAILLRAAHRWMGGGSEILVISTELTDGGLLRIHGRIISGQDRGFVGSWSVPLDQTVEVAG